MLTFCVIVGMGARVITFPLLWMCVSVLTFSVIVDVCENLAITGCGKRSQLLLMLLLWWLWSWLWLCQCRLHLVCDLDILDTIDFVHGSSRCIPHVAHQSAANWDHHSGKQCRPCHCRRCGLFTCCNCHVVLIATDEGRHCCADKGLGRFVAKTT